MSIPTPKNAPIKRRLSDEEKKAVQTAVLDEGTDKTIDVTPGQFVNRSRAQVSSVSDGKPDHQLREHLMQRPFAKDPAFAELARQTREGSGALEAQGIKSVN